MVSAFATDIGLVLGQEAVADKSNEITAIPALLEALAIKGCLVSIDAMGCQKEIAASIRARHADYLLTVKNNQPKLRTALEDAFAQMPDDEGFEYIDQGHGRTVIQYARTIKNTGQVDTAVWTDCKWFGQFVSRRIEGRQRQTTELRYYISSVERKRSSAPPCSNDDQAVAVLMGKSSSIRL
jgi:hypothetical protein